MNKNKLKELEKYFLKDLKDMGYELMEISFEKEKDGDYLVFYLDKPGGITIDDCEKASIYISEKLDEIDPIEESYFLSVSSIDISRNIKEDKYLKKFFGEPVTIKFYKKIDDIKEIEGTLDGFDDEFITLLDDEQIPKNYKRENIASVKLIIC